MQNVIYFKVEICILSREDIICESCGSAWMFTNEGRNITMNFKKALSIILVLLTVALAASALLATQSSAESLYIKKVVSVVYDDSGSMGGAKETYANYAMQTFCGMLNAEDKLYITYMSDYNHAKELKLTTTADVENSLKDIRAHGADAGSTPYQAVVTAYNRLMDKAGADTNPNTQYFLLVITDGSYTDNAAMNNLSNLNAQLMDYTDGVAPNGTNPKITYMTIGNSVQQPTSVPDRIYTYHAESADEITAQMSEMADRISGRTRVSRSDVSVSGKTATFTTNVPLLNVAVLSQNADAAITKLTVNNEDEFSATRSHKVYYTGYTATGSYSLKGGTALIGGTQKIMPAGKYVITFDKNVNAKDLDFLLEPALETRMTVKINGKQVSDVLELRNAMEGDTIDISYKIYEIGTDKEVAASLLPTDTTYGVTVKENGVVVKESDGMSLDGYKLKKTPTELTVSVKIPGVNAITYSTKFTPKEYVPTYTVTGAFEDPAKTEIKIKDIASNSDVRMLFTVYADGVALKDKSAVQALAPSLGTSVAGNEGKVEYLDNGQIAFTPNKASAPSGTLSSYTVSVTCSAMGGSATLDYTVKVVEYTLDGSLEGGSEVFYKGIEQNDTFKLVFTLYADGKAVTDKKTVTDLAPTLTCTPDGNSGSFEVDGQGRIVFTPNRANDEAKDKDQTVTVTCTVAGVSKELTYTVKATVYTMQMEYENGQQSVKLDEIGSNDKTKLLFTFFANGVQLTNEELTALAPQISCEPAGNGGKSEIKDGVLIFTPNAASAPAGVSDSYTVKVSCSIGQTTFEPVEYTVLIADYSVVAIESDNSVVKTKFFGNTEGVSFYITKDGEPLSKAQLEGLLLSASGGKKYKNLKFDVKIEDVGDKGVITCTPYSEKEHKITVLSWLVNYICYWTLPGSDMNVQLSTPYGTGENELEVDPESIPYLVLNVWTPLILELVVLAALIWWLYCYFNKPRFISDGVVYTGTLIYDKVKKEHTISGWACEPLSKWNKFKYLWHPVRKPLEFDVGENETVRMQPGYGSNIICLDDIWYAGTIKPKFKKDPKTGEDINNPEAIRKYFINNSARRVLPIETLVTNNADKSTHLSSIDSPKEKVFYVIPADGQRVNDVDGRHLVIERGVIFCYTTQRDEM